MFIKMFIIASKLETTHLCSDGRMDNKQMVAYCSVKYSSTINNNKILMPAITLISRNAEQKPDMRIHCLLLSV